LSSSPKSGEQEQAKTRRKNNGAENPPEATHYSQPYRANLSCQREKPDPLGMGQGVCFCKEKMLKLRG